MKNFEKYLIPENALIYDALVQLNNLSNDVQTLFAVDVHNRLHGTLTDGDIRRAFIAGKKVDDTIEGTYNKNFRYIKDNEDNVLKIKAFIAENIFLLPLLSSEGKIIRIYNLKKHRNILPIDAVLMAGGKGMRLRPLTENTPKPLLPVGDKVIIDYNIDNLRKYGIDNINVTVNYLAEQIKDHFASPVQDTMVNCVEEPSFMGTIGSVKFVSHFYHDTILVMNSDLFTDIDLEEFYIHFKKNNADMSAVAIPYSVNVPYGIFELKERRVQGIVEKPIYNYYANAGIYLIKRELLNLIPEGQFYNATDFMSLLIEKGFSVIRYPHNGIWIDIGKHEDYNRVKEIVKHKSLL
jgi:dTDP-glucose pyrophosphorylase